MKHVKGGREKRRGERYSNIMERDIPNRNRERYSNIKDRPFHSAS
jgi:hypothetical protein